MEIDTGAAKSVISYPTYLKKFSHLPLQPAKVKLKAYNGGCISVLGQFVAKVEYEDQVTDLPLLVVRGHGASLCGRNWLTKLQLNWQQIKYMGELKHLSLNELLDAYSDVFKDELGTLKDITATIVVRPEVPSKFCKHRPLPFAMKEKVEKELERLEKCNIITPVRHSEWAAPIVPVLKRDVSICLCGDYKVSVNQALEADTYPLPHLEELLATLSGGKYFSKIDLAAAYQQVLLNEDSKKYTTINTHKGLLVYNRLPFGISTAPSIFQHIMENIMKGLPVVVYLDDLLITGHSKAEHLCNLEKALRRLQENGLRVKRSKFNKPQIEYLGHVLDEHGVHPSEEKVRAIQDAPAPTNVKELQAFLGLINYYGRFVPMQSTALAPLYKLLKDSVTWRWTEPEQAAFNRCKGLLTSDRVLEPYDPNLPLPLACDASAYGISAVIQHTMPTTDHRPLLTLFGEHKNLPTLAAARIQRNERHWNSIEFGNSTFTAN
ncbi:uncharacterized protein K02A2.6-like [Poecilia formosa]|uniref:uncharacterized protein K02A2.6-like n=1 Tax=Poecilia formosa TaxID=48698 RepID=UPI0007B8EF22|nr:PREDICTED: uncharacterized protein K02A2.6-like [Poecilia formosa]